MHGRNVGITFFCGPSPAVSRFRAADKRPNNPRDYFSRLSAQSPGSVQCLLVKRSMQGTENMGKHGARCLRARCLTIKYSATTVCGSIRTEFSVATTLIGWPSQCAGWSRLLKCFLWIRFSLETSQNFLWRICVPPVNTTKEAHFYMARHVRS